MGKTLRILSVSVGLLALAACGGAGSDGPAGGVQPSDLTPTAEPDRPSPTETAEPVPLPPQVRSLVARLTWDGFLEGEIDFSFENPEAAPFTVQCSSEPTKAPVGQQVINAEGAGALAFRRDYLAELTHTPAELIETFTCVPDNGLTPVTLRFPVRGPDGLDQQFQRQPPISARGLAFIAVHRQEGEQDQHLILEARLAAAGLSGNLDCSATPAGAPTTFLFGDVKPFSAGETTVRFPLPDVEARRSPVAPDADIEFLCNFYGPDDRTPTDSRTLTLTPPLP
ncbi:MAG: hypothetical protein A2Z17_07260 [Gammaproteobacteria bacterium RBG_16_66_13]|nr:MAG: hypothetical protein A2Z17_07260 [Gammaproteobacteria bacterium RBG_16_66_13]